MASQRKNVAIRPSLFDRLTDLNAEGGGESTASDWAAIRDIRASLARDLAALLNTRRKDVVMDPDFTEAINSVLTYGIPDYTSYSLTNGVEQELVRRSIERAIRQFEPRLHRVSVTLEQPDSEMQSLIFQIEAALKIGDEPVTFDVRLHRDARRMNVTGADR